MNLNTIEHDLRAFSDYILGEMDKDIEKMKKNSAKTEIDKAFKEKV